MEPSITIRHDTANVAALAGAILQQEEEDEQVTNFDDDLVSKALGPQQERDSSDEASSSEDTRTPTPLPADQTVEETVNQKGKVEVVTSVTVVASTSDSEERKSSNGSPELAARPAPKESEPDSGNDSSEDNKERKTSEVTIPQEQQSLMVTVAMDDSDATTSSDDEDEIPEGSTTEMPEDKPEEVSEASEASPVVSIPPVITVEKADTLKREAPEQNGEASAQSKENGGSDSEKEADCLVPTVVQRRRGEKSLLCVCVCECVHMQVCV